MLMSEQASAGGGFGLHEWQAIRFLLRHESTCVLSNLYPKKHWFRPENSVWPNTCRFKCKRAQRYQASAPSEQTLCRSARSIGLRGQPVGRAPSGEAASGWAPTEKDGKDRLSDAATVS